MTDYSTSGQLNAAGITRARNANFVVFAVAGMAVASWLSRVPDIRTQLQLTPSQLSVLLLSIAIGSILGLPASGRITHRFGSIGTVRFGAAVAFLGLVLAAIGVQFTLPVVVSMVGLFLLGFGLGIWDVAMNFEGATIEQALGRSIMPWFHAFFSAGTVIGSLIGALATALRLPLGIHIGAVTVLFVLAIAWCTRWYVPERANESEPAQVVLPKQRSAWLEPRTLLIGVMVLAAAFAEGTANDWMAVAFVDGHSVSPTNGVLALSVFLGFMTAGRIFGTMALDRFGRLWVLRVLFISSVIGNLMVVFGNVWVAFIGSAIWGLGASLGFPVGMSAAADEPARAAMRISVVATLGYVAFLAGPPLLGFLGDTVGVLRALLAVAVVSIFAVLSASAAKPIT